MVKRILQVFLAVFLATMTVTGVSGEPAVKADRVLVVKSEYRMVLIREGSILREYPVFLGADPEGAKLQMGDFKTPEGQYTLDRRNPESEYYKSIHISYPNAENRRKATVLGVDPGGDIMIHGMPTGVDLSDWDYSDQHWTNGCIAVRNEHMDEIWRLVDDGTPIEIRP